MKTFLSWIFFFIGDIASKMVWGEGLWADVMFWCYQSSMRVSVYLQGENERGPWEIVKNLDDRIKIED